MRILLYILCLLFITSFVYAEGMDAFYDQLYNQAKQAIDEGDENKADFYLARYMGLTWLDKDTEKTFTDLYPLFKIYKGSAPISFISGRYEDNFINWFVFSSHAQWGLDEEGIDEEKYSFEIISNSDDKYFVSIIAYPYIESWSLLKGENISTLIMALGDFERKPYIISGRLENGKPVEYFNELSLNLEEHPLQYVWLPKFYDLDNDGIPEIWLRYNKAWADGFSQELAIYKIKEGKKLELFKKFEGLAEGIARRLNDGTIEVAEGFGNSGHLAYDKHHVEIYKYSKGEFEKVSERDMPHILHSSEWKRYYFNQE